MPSFLSSLLGTLESAFQVGSKALPGLRRLRFRNNAGAIDLEATPTADRTITLPDRSGTVLVRDGLGNIGGGILNDLSALTVADANAGRFDVAASGTNMGVELRNTAGGLTFFDITSHPTRDFDLRVLVSADGTQGIFTGRPELSFFYDRPSTFTESVWLTNASGSKSLSFAGSATTQENIDFFVGPNLTWRLLRAPTSGDLVLQRYVGGAYQENLLAFTNATGQLTLAKTAWSVDPLYLRASSQAGVDSIQRWETDGTARWTLGKDSAAESGSNAGGDMALNSYSDAGALLATPLKVVRATGRTHLTSLAISGRLTSYDGSAPANGQILIGNNADFQPNTLTPGPGIAITNGSGSITIAAAPAGYSTILNSTTLALTDAGSVMHFTNTSPVTLTIPADSSVNFPVGAEIRVMVDRLVHLNYAAVTLVNYTSLPRHALLRGFEYKLRKVAANTWHLKIDDGLPLFARYFDAEFLGGTSIPDWLLSSAGGSGSNLSSPVASPPTISTSRPGMIQVETGQASNGWRALHTNITAFNTLSGYAYWFSCVCAASNLSDATNAFDVRLGLQNNVNSATSPAVFFRASQANNTALYQAVARTATTESVVNTTRNTTTTSKFDILYIPATLARFWIDDTQVAEITTNLPAADTLMGVQAGIYKTAGTTSRLLYINRMQLCLPT